jgi:hypothetical protein
MSDLCHTILPRPGQGGLSQTPERYVYDTMLQRCYNPARSTYARYGGRGIVVCDRWRTSFRNFLADMGLRPSPTSTLDRIDNDGAYSPENCRWADRRTQARNRSSNRLLEFQGVTRTLAEWSEITGLGRCTIAERIDASGWDVAAALTTPVLRQRRYASRWRASTRDS